MKLPYIYWVVVSNIFYFQPYLGKWSILTNIFQMGWNHQLDLAGFTDNFPITFPKIDVTLPETNSIQKTPLKIKGWKVFSGQTAVSFTKVIPNPLESMVGNLVPLIKVGSVGSI